MPPENERRPGEGASNEVPGAGEHTDAGNVGKDRPQGERLSQFFTSLFGDQVGWIEVRVIQDRQGGGLVDRCWYQNAGDLVAGSARLNEISARHSAGVFLGVLRRREHGTGKAKDVLDGHVVWADIDFHDFTDGEREARERLSSYALPPSIIVRSGHD